jgi:membrane protein
LLKGFRKFFNQVYSAYGKDRIASLSAGLSYYTLFSLTPILLISLALLGLVLGPEAARGQILQQTSGLVGYETGLQIQTMIENADQPSNAFTSQAIGIIALIFGATGVFTEIQSGLNFIWKVKPKFGRGWQQIIKQRILSFAMVLCIAFLLLVSLVLTVVMTTLGGYITHFLGVSFVDFLLAHTLSFVMVVVLFAMMYKILPDAQIRWREVWLGAFIAALFFTLGKFLLGFYLSKVNLANAFGAAGSLVVLLVWVYFAAQIFFIGAEITYVFSTQRRQVVPKAHAVCKKSANSSLL